MQKGCSPRFYSGLDSGEDYALSLGVLSGLLNRFFKACLTDEFM